MASSVMEAFVIQPIRDRQDPDHEHFKAIYSRLRDLLGGQGYRCVRADEVEKRGAITKDVITRLGSADLVVADLTDLNPNVYYELGVRHALRGSGTLLILDEKRTQDIPFDLSAYRVIKFEGTLQGISRLEERLLKALDPTSESGPGTDNPVHDWLPELPGNALAAADGSEAGELRRQLKEHEEALSRYRDRFGALESTSRDGDSSPLSVVMGAVAAAQDGNTPAQLARDAEQAVQQRDVNEFLSVIRRIIENDVKIDKNEAISLAFGADRLGLEEVGRAILKYVADYLDDDDLQQAILMKGAHSNDPHERAWAREELARRSGLRVTADGKITLPASLSKSQAVDLALLLDVLDKDGNNLEALAIAHAWVVISPNSSFALRHLARSYGSLGRRDISREVYRAALAAPDMDDTTPRWLGVDYHNSDETVNSLEAYVFAARHDPDDSNLFAHAADEMATALRDRLLGRTAIDNRRLPSEITQSDFETCVRASLSCSAVDQEAIKRVESAARRLDVGSSDMTQGERMDLAARHQFAADLFEKLSSEATKLLSSLPADGWPDLSDGANWENFANLDRSAAVAEPA